MRLFATGSLLGAIGLSFFLFACPSPRRITIGSNGFRQTPEQRAAANQQQQSTSTTNGSAAGPIELLNRVEQTMTAGGYSRVGTAIRNSNIAQTGLVAYAVPAQPGQCYVAVALANQGSNLDMIVIGPDGTQLGSNTAADPYPYVSFCAQRSGRHLVRLQLLAGGGEVYYAVYQGRGDAPDLHATLGLSPAQAAPASRRVELDSNTARRLSSFDQRIQAEGFSRAGEVREGYVLSSGEERRYQMQLEGGFCYSLVSLGGPGATDTALALIGSDGQNIVENNGNGADAELRYCPPAPGRYTLRARLFEGQGPVFVGAWSRRNADVQAANTTASATTTVVTEGTTSSGVDEDWGYQNADLLARGYRALGVEDAQLASGTPHQTGIALTQGHCYAFLAVGAGQIPDLDLVISDPNGRQAARDLGTSVQTVVRHCAASTGTYSVVTSSAGSGPIRLGAFEWTGSTQAPFGLEGLGAVRFHEVSALLGQEGFEPDANVMPGGGTLRSQGAHATETIDLDNGVCLAVVVIGGDGLQNLDVTLERRGAALSADSSQDASPAIRHCTSESGEYQIDIRAAAGQGEYHYFVYSRDN